MKSVVPPLLVNFLLHHRKLFERELNNKVIVGGTCEERSQIFPSDGYCDDYPYGIQLPSTNPVQEQTARRLRSSDFS